MNRTAMAAAPTPPPEQFWPVSITGWLTFSAVAVAVVRWGWRKLRGFDKNTDKWNEAADALKQLSTNVSELLYEIRGVNGKGGIYDRLDTIDSDISEVKTEIAEIKERNAEADVFVDMYRTDLLARRDRGEPIRREVDQILVKTLAPDAQ